MKIIIIKDDGTKIVSDKFLIVNYSDNDDENLTMAQNIPLGYLMHCLNDLVQNIDENEIDCDCPQCTKTKDNVIQGKKVAVDKNTDIAYN